MRPEDIDKLFKERLGNTTPTPPGDLWSRLQERLEDEMPAQPEAKQNSFMWVRYAAAAAVTLLLAVGLVFYTLQHDTPSINGSVAQQETEKQRPLHETQDFTPKVLEEQAAPASMAKAENKGKVNNLPAQATEATSTASTHTKALAQNTETTARPATTMKKATTPVKTAAEQAKAIAHQKPAKQPAATEISAPEAHPALTTAVATAAVPDAAAGAEPVEIIIKRAVGTQTFAAEASEPNGLEKKARLAKNIFKQARNLSNGEPVELADLGIRASSIAVETKIGNQKYSKVINF